MTHIDSYYQQNKQQFSKMPISDSFNGTSNGHHHSFSNSSNKFNSLTDPTSTSSSISIVENFNKRLATEDTMIEVLKSNFSKNSNNFF
jgi:hypothetical protein